MDILHPPGHGGPDDGPPWLCGICSPVVPRAPLPSRDPWQLVTMSTSLRGHRASISAAFTSFPALSWGWAVSSVGARVPQRLVGWMSLHSRDRRRPLPDAPQ
jgi:hypothetical protein